MLEFESKRKTKKLIFSKLTIVILVVILVLLIDGTLNVYKKSIASSKKVSMVEEKLEKITERKDSLENKIVDIESEVGKEELLREKYSVAKEGEQAVFILDSENIETVDEKEKGILKNFFDHLNPFN
jgi:cell division protein FtsB